MKTLLLAALLLLSSGSINTVEFVKTDWEVVQNTKHNQIFEREYSKRVWNKSKKVLKMSSSYYWKVTEDCYLFYYGINREVKLERKGSKIIIEYYIENSSD